MRAILLLLLLSGCAAAPTYHHWYKAGLGGHPQELSSDWYDCIRENSGGKLPADMTAQERHSADAMAVQCMQARGYTLAWSDNNPQNLPLTAKPISTALR